MFMLLGSVLGSAGRVAAALLLMTAAVLAQATSPPGGAPASQTAVATFAGGCFWCMEPPFDALEGVISTTSGYMGGTTPNPTYEQVSAGGTGHIEVVQVIYDPVKVSYDTLLHVYWRNVDPYDAGGQFCDRGDSYTTAIFTHTPEQRQMAEASKSNLQKTGPLRQDIATVVRDAAPFTAAEDYHQDYYMRNPVRYAFYRYSCGRDARLKEVWGHEAGAKDYKTKPTN